MIVWGGTDDSNLFDTGGRYDPSTDSWIATNSTTNVPTARYGHTAVWTGSEMIVWGGYSHPNYLNTGGRYNPTTDSWGPQHHRRAVHAMGSHGSVDRQRNGRLGWVFCDA